MIHRSLRSGSGDPHARRLGDSNEMFAFRQRMTTEEAKAILKNPTFDRWGDRKFTKQGTHSTAERQQLTTSSGYDENPWQQSYRWKMGR